MVIEGRVWKFGDDVSTDLLYPQDAYRLPRSEAAKLVFRANRPGWTEHVERGDLIIGGRNFGMGSARPAVTLLRELGVAACVAESFGSIFFRNCNNYGFPVIAAPGVTSMVEEGGRLRVDFAVGRIEDAQTGEELDVDPLPPLLLDIVASGGLLASLEEQGLIERSVDR